MAVGGGVFVAPAPGRGQLEPPDDFVGAEVEDGAAREHPLQRRVGDAVRRAVGLDAEADGAVDADGVGDLDLAAVGETGGDDVLRRVARVVGRRAVHLRRVLARERAAAVRGHAAVGVDDDLAPGEPRVAARPADDELARGVDEELRLRGEEPRRSEVVLRAPLQLGVVLLRRAGRGRLVREDDGVDCDGLAVRIDDGELALRVGPQPFELPRVAQVGEHLQEPMRINERRGHQRRRFVRRVAEHHSLVARAELRLFLAVDALRDVGRLAVQEVEILEGVGGEVLLRHGVADLARDAARDRGGVDLLESLGRDFADVDDDVGADGRFAGDARVPVAREAGVKDGIGDLVRHFVGMSFRDGLRRKDVAMLLLDHFHSL